MKTLVFFFFIGSSLTVSAQVTDSTDWKSAREDLLQPIEVSSTRDHILRKAYSFTQPYLIHPSENRTESVSAILSRSPGLEIKDYGGNGGLKTVSARGTSASQNLVILDGMVMNDALSGSANLSLLSAETIGQVAVQTGGFSADVANGGLGSTIYLNTRQTAGTKSLFRSSAGSFGTRSYQGVQHLGFGAFTGYFSFSSDWTDGNFPLQSGMSRVNQDYSGKSGFSTFTYKKNEIETALSLFLTSQNQGIPGPVFADNSNFSTARLVSADFKAIPTVSILTSGGLFRTSAMVRSQKMNFTDPALPSGKSNLKEQELSLRSDFLTETRNDQWNSGFYLRSNRSQADIWRGRNETDKLERNSLAFFSTKTVSFSESGFKIQINGRVEGGKNQPAAGSGAITISCQPGHLNTSLTFNRNSRYPSLNELRLTPAGTKNLVSEKFTGIDGDITLPFLSGLVRFKSFYYFIEDKIISIPKNPVVWSTINAGQVQGYGIEQSLEWQWTSVSLHQYFTFQSVKSINGISSQSDGKQLIYTPGLTAGVSVIWVEKDWELESNWRFTGSRNASVENLKSDRLPGFFLGDVSVSRKFIFPVVSLTSDFSIKNLTNQSYEWVMSYPMPGRSYLVTLTLETNL